MVEAPIRIPFINSSNASALAKLSWEARKLKQAETEPSNAHAVADSYASQSLSRTRRQLDRLRDWLDEAEDAKDADAITRSIERLAKLECYLANRPGPGNYKPTSPRQSRDRAPIAPVDVPQPETQQSVPEPPSA